LICERKAKEENGKIIHHLNQVMEKELRPGLQLNIFDTRQTIVELLVLALGTISTRELKHNIEEEDLICYAIHELLETNCGSIIWDGWQFDNDESIKCIMAKYQNHHDLQMWNQIKHKMVCNDHPIV